MPKLPKGRLLAELLRIRAEANLILSNNNLVPAYTSRLSKKLVKDLNSILTKLKTEFPSQFSSITPPQKYNRNTSEVVRQVLKIVKDLVQELSSQSSASSASSAST